MLFRQEEIDLAHLVIREVVVLGKTPGKVAYNRPELSVGDVERILQQFPGIVKQYRETKKALERKKYERLSKRSLAAITRILDLVPVGEDGKIDVPLAKLQKEVAIEVLEATGAKKPRTSKGGGIQVNTQVNAGGDKRSRSRSPVAVKEADAVLLLESARLEESEIRLIEEEGEES